MRTVLIRIWELRRIVVLWAVLLGIGLLIGGWMQSVVVPELRPMNEPMIHRMVMGALIVYVFAAAIPFVPGAEIGFALLLIFGGVAAPVVYAGMVGALLLAYLVARFIPADALAAALAWLGLARVAALIRRVNALPREEREAMILERLPNGFLRRLCKSRYLSLAILLNLPGNSVIGGGGGLAFAAGASGLYGVLPFVATILLAVAPVPLFFFLM